MGLGGRPGLKGRSGRHGGLPLPWCCVSRPLSALSLKGAGQSLCAKLLCACDRTAAQCMAAAFFNQSLAWAGRQECQGSPPPCEDGVQGGPSTPSPGSSSEDSSEEAGPQGAHLRRVRRFLGKSLSPVRARPPHHPR